MNESTLVPREEMSDLDWLARNVHKVGIRHNFIRIERNSSLNENSWQAIVTHEAGECGEAWFTKEQWLARRAELQNKPSWDKHGWPQIFQNEDGHWFGARTGWDFKAHISGGWKGDGVSLLRDDGECLRSGTILGDWRDTLEKRPEQTIADICREVTGENRHEEIFEPFVSVEDEHQELSELEMLAKVSHLISDKRHRKQLTPFAGVEGAKITIMQSDSDVKNFGGIIGRSLPLKEDVATAKQHDPVNSPSHYASGGIECIDAIKASMSHEAFLGFLKGNVQKYMWRHEKKVNHPEDLKKARWYLDRLIEEQK